jgi:hypothetical protein
MNGKNGTLVLLGLSSDGKPHAARFNGTDAIALVKAAQSMGLKIGRPDTSEAMTLVRGLPEGKIFASGKALVPLVKGRPRYVCISGLVPKTSKVRSKFHLPAKTK